MSWVGRRLFGRPAAPAAPETPPAPDSASPRRLSVARRLAQVNDELHAMIAGRARTADLLPRLVYRDGLLEARDKAE